jgi:hypothetical protein
MEGSLYEGSTVIFFIFNDKTLRQYLQDVVIRHQSSFLDLMHLLLGTSHHSNKFPDRMDIYIGLKFLLKNYLNLLVPSFVACI